MPTDTSSNRPIRGMLHPMLDHLLQIAVDSNASDLHLQAAQAPRLRVAGSLRKLGEWVPTEEEMVRLAASLMSDADHARLSDGKEVDLAFTDAEHGRFRIHAYRQMGTVAISFRRIVDSVPSFTALGLPDVVRRLAEEPRGLVLVTGPTGSGKTTTLAAMIQHINHRRECHIVTIEDPIEVVHRPDLAEISQREIGFDTESYATAMKAAMRQDPDVILVGEMRDIDTVSAAITAAETGHLVLSTLHTSDAPEAVNRIIDFFPPHQHQQVRDSLAHSLRGVIAQRLIPTIEGRGQVPAVEVLVGTGRVQQCILTPGRTGDIPDLIAEGDYYGMRTFDQSLAALLRDGRIDRQAALFHATSPHDLELTVARQPVPSA